jgi:hypothetical protein
MLIPIVKQALKKMFEKVQQQLQTLYQRQWSLLSRLPLPLPIFTSKIMKSVNVCTR